MGVTRFDGFSTPNVVKLGLEAYMAYNLGVIQDVGKYASNGGVTGVYTPETGNPPEFNILGEDLMLRASNALRNSIGMIVTVTGTDLLDAALTGTATFAPYGSEGVAHKVVSTGGVKWKTVTTITATNGIAGDGLQICTMLNHANDVELGFADSVNPDFGTRVKSIPKHYDYDHMKRIRGDNKLTVTNPYFTNLVGLSAINNRDVCMLVSIQDDGQALPTEVWIIDGARLSVKTSAKTGPEEIMENADGMFKRIFFFS